MPAIDTRGGDGEGDIEVLITGFGPFMGYVENPAWLATRALHDVYLSTSAPPPSQDPSASPPSSSPRIHLQAIQSSVVYSNVLSLVPLIHGVEPSAPEAEPYLDPAGDQPDQASHSGPQGNGAPFPSGYPVRLPAKGKFDLVVHVGVGLPGAIVVESVGHKRGYQMKDTKGDRAPVATDQSETIRKERKLSEAEKRERDRSGGEGGAQIGRQTDAVRGFGRGYEAYADEEVNGNNVAGLVKWLNNECNLPNVRQSHDAGRYLCDFIYYCSLCEAKRRGANTKVQFIHIPPTNEPLSTIECTSTIEKIIWWLVCRDGKGE